MSIALHARIKDLESRIKGLESAVDILRAEKAEEKPVLVLADADGFVDVGGGLEVDAASLLKAEPGSVIPAKRKPGRPPKNG